MLAIDRDLNKPGTFNEVQSLLKGIFTSLNINMPADTSNDDEGSRSRYF